MIEELEKLLKEATPGPWRYHDDFLHIDTEDEKVVNTQNDNNSDGQLICLLRNNAEKLLAILKTAAPLFDYDNVDLIPLKKAFKVLDSSLASIRNKDLQKLITALEALETSPPTPGTSDQP